MRGKRSSTRRASRSPANPSTLSWTESRPRDFPCLELGALPGYPTTGGTMRRSGWKRWELGRLSFGFGWDLDGLTLPRFYRYRDQPECFGLRVAPKTCDDFFSIDFTWKWPERAC